MSNNKEKAKKLTFDPLSIPTDEKVDKKFGAEFNKLVAFMGGRKNLRPAKVKTDQVDEVLKEMFQEDFEKAKESLKNDVRQFLNDYLDFKTETTKAWNLMVKTIKEEKSKFAERASKLNKSMQDVNGFMAAKKELLSTEGIGGSSAGEAEEAEPEAEPDSQSEAETNS